MALYEVYVWATQNPLIAIGIGAAALLVGSLIRLFLSRSARKAREELDEELEDADEWAIKVGEVVELDPPALRRSRFGMVGELLRTWRYLKKRERLLDKGYVQWLLVDDSYPWPRFIKPAQEGGGIPELEKDGERYLFPKDAMLPDAKQGFWTVVHRKGEADPINLRDPDELAIKTDELHEYLTERMSMSPPGFLDRLDLDARTVMMYGIGAIVAYTVLQGGVL